MRCVFVRCVRCERASESEGVRIARTETGCERKEKQRSSSRSDSNKVYNASCFLMVNKDDSSLVLFPDQVNM